MSVHLVTCRELTNGIPVLTEDGEVVGQSQAAAKRGIAQVVFSRIVMAVPGMCECVNAVYFVIFVTMCQCVCCATL